jgi:hypothetical protein
MSNPNHRPLSISLQFAATFSLKRVDAPPQSQRINHQLQHRVLSGGRSEKRHPANNIFCHDGGTHSLAGGFVRTLLLIAWLATAGLDVAEAKAEPSHTLPGMPGAAPAARPETIPAKVRLAGLIPATLPKRVGSTYVMRAVDQHGKMFRVVAAADSGNIVAVRPVPARTGRGHEGAKRKSVIAPARARVRLAQVPKDERDNKKDPGDKKDLDDKKDSGDKKDLSDKKDPGDKKDAPDDGLVLMLGRLSADSDGARQVLSLENRTAINFSAVGVECGFYAQGRLVGSGYTAVADLAPRALAHADVVGRHISDADDVKCRIIARR